MFLVSAFRTSLLLAGILVSIVSSAAIAEGTVRLNFGVYSSNKPSAMVKVYRPILRELEENMTRRLGQEVDIRMQIAKDYDQGISHLINGRVDFSAFGPASYLEAKRMNKDISILAIENVNNSKVVYGIIAVNQHSPISDIKELRGKSFAFGDEGSTIGRFLSQLELEQAGIRAGDLNRYEYLGRHDKVGTAVGAGSFDAGALNEKTFKKLVEAGEPIRELVRFPNVTKPWIARSGLDPKILVALRESLLEVNDKKTLAALKIDGFLDGDDSDYKVIRKAMGNNQAFFAERDDEAIHNAALARPDMSKIEPALHAAIDVNSQDIDMSNLVNITHTTNSTLITHANGGPDDHFVTLNISLPRTLFEPRDDKQAHRVVINLTIPETEADSTSNPANGH
ncbi:PhnD/SsuA/transferrin family substrate-binding protein [Granulosicoccus antarcticus]|uniref:Phosphate-import protein PhnD n=1 Tax=Granulosicoccus antarcticus IMCC3135 TaxID=1192854 RepID=A0A2Z2NJC6_9GAMM|nr:PhnD/SsuA/transferrin family substrate-binding protein [Granulosicoccus antarcticus]ASJ70171.1 Phosphate-import protein PhnD [Granulosicoccus antarcticus IMCC3135]